MASTARAAVTDGVAERHRRVAREDDEEETVEDIGVVETAFGTTVAS